MKNWKEYKAIVFDLDGTLYFQKPLRLYMAASLGFWYLFHFNKRQELSLLSKFRKVRENWIEIAKGEDAILEGETLSEAHYRHAVKGTNITSLQMDELVTNWMDVKPLRFLRVCRDRHLCNFIKELRKEGIQIVVYSDCPIGKKLEVLLLEVDYEFSAYDEMIGTMKPDSKGFKVIMETLELSKEDVLMVGDRMEKDGESAKQVGIDYCILERTYWKRRKQMKHDSYVC